VILLAVLPEICYFLIEFPLNPEVFGMVHAATALRA
jgi:hypothetical protein